MRVCRFARLLLLVITVPLASVSAETASSRLDEIVARGTLRVGLTGDYQRFSSAPLMRTGKAPIARCEDKESGAYGALLRRWLE